MEKTYYPQLPAGVWWRTREAFQKTVPTKVTDTYLSSMLEVKQEAAQKYISALRTLALLNEDNTPTDLAYKWRTDEQYAESCETILKSVYPPELLDLAPPPEPDRDLVVRWFRDSARLGIGSAKNRAATYLLIAKGDPEEGESVSSQPRTVTTRDRKFKSDSTRGRTRKDMKSSGRELKRQEKEENTGLRVSPELQLNIQIHISSEASVEQINAIFESMARYFKEH